MYHRSGSGKRSAPAAVGTATVTDDGCFLLPDGSRYLNPASATIAYRGNTGGTWDAWAAPGGQRLGALRQRVRDNRRRY